MKVNGKKEKKWERNLFKKGDIFDGIWKDGKRNGIRSYVKKGGEKEEGVWEKDILKEKVEK